jgi:hypothetical protein
MMHPMGAKTNDMGGVSYIVDAKGRRRAVVVDLDKHGDLWEDVFDNMIAEARRGDERLSWEAVSNTPARKKSRKA